MTDLGDGMCSRLVPRPGDFVIVPLNLGAPGPAFGTWETTNLGGLGTRWWVTEFFMLLRQLRCIPAAAQGADKLNAGCELAGLEVGGGALVGQQGSFSGEHF